MKLALWKCHLIFLQDFVLYHCALWTHIHVLCINLKSFILYLLTIVSMSFSSCSLIEKIWITHHLEVLPLFFCLADDSLGHLCGNKKPWQQTAWSLLNLEPRVQNMPLSRQRSALPANMWGLKTSSADERCCFLRDALWMIVSVLLHFGVLFWWWCIFSSLVST